MEESRIWDVFAKSRNSASRLRCMPVSVGLRAVGWFGSLLERASAMLRAISSAVPPLVLTLATLPLVCACGRHHGKDSRPATVPVLTAQQLLARGYQAADGGDWIRAEQYFLAARQAGVEETSIMPLLVKVCVRSGRLRNALQHAEPYLERHPGDWALRFLVAELLVAVGDEERARDELEEVLRQRPEQAECHFSLGMLLLPQPGQGGVGAEHLRRFLQLEPKTQRSEQARAALARWERGKLVAAQAGQARQDGKQAASLPKRVEP